MANKLISSVAQQPGSVINSCKIAKGDQEEKSERVTPDGLTGKSSESAAAPSPAREAEDNTHTGPVLPHLIVERYEGERRGEVFHGEGLAVFHGGHVYKGSFVEGLMHGHGEYTWADGIRYEGEFVMNALMGHGSYTWLDGSTYEGEVCYGIRHGVGTYKCAKTSTVYRGQWHQSKKHGKGTIYYNKEATSWYEGDWENNHRNGWGVRSYPSGNIYQGQWKNNVRHGEGTMNWIQLGQQYSGQWLNGVQHGQGKHTWFLRRVPGSQYPLRNEYEGEFVQGLRHGQGTFTYASGAVYSGGWNHNKKHGQGKFIFKNGRIFEGEFINDRMAEFPAFCIKGTKSPDLSGIRTHSPPPDGGELNRRAKKSGVPVSVLGSDIALNIETLLNRIAEAQRGQELRQVEFAIMRHLALLREIYSFYSSLGRDHSPDNTFLLTYLQFWCFLKDCGVHLHGITLAQIDHLIDEDITAEEVHSPFRTILLRQCLSYIVIVAYHIYHKDIRTSSNILVECFSKFMRQNVIPNAKNVKGPLFCNPVRAGIGMKYIDRCWEIYQAICKSSSPVFSDQTMTARHFIWMFKDLGLFDKELTTGKLLQILSLENPAIYNSSHSNLNLEITFLEFFEALLYCADAKTIHGVNTAEHHSETSRISSKYETRDSPLLSLQASPQCESTLESSKLSPDVEQRINPSKLAAINQDGCEIELNKETVGPIDAAAAEAPMRDKEEERWIQKTHQFFTQIFYPAHKHYLLLKEEMHEERQRQITRNQIALEKAKENARLREQWEAEEEERRKAEEEENEERGGSADDLNHSSPALVTPVASSSSVGLKPSPASGSKKKRK